MKLGVTLVAVVAAGWLGMEGYYFATGKCPLTGEGSSCQPDTIAVAAAPTLGATAQSDGCCPSLSPGALPVAHGMSPGAVNSPGAASPGAISPTGAASPGAATTGGESAGAISPTGAASPGAATTGGQSPGAISPTGAASPGAATTGGQSPGAVSPSGAMSPGSMKDGCCGTAPAPAAPIAPTGTCPPREGCLPGDANCDTKAPATGLATPKPTAATMAEDDCGGCCGGDVAAVETQTPVRAKN